MEDVNDDGALIGTASCGTIVGELCLLEHYKNYSVSVKADPEGATFVGIDRASFWNFVGVACNGPSSATGHVAAALRAACCERILRMAPSDRSDSDLESLVAFLSGLQV